MVYATAVHMKEYPTVITTSNGGVSVKLTIPVNLNTSTY